MNMDEMKYNEKKMTKPWDDKGYWYSSSSPTGNGMEGYLGGRNNEDWMRWLPGTTKISELSIPGTHRSTGRDTELSIVSDYLTTQRMTISTQLKAGIRYLDIRARCKRAPSKILFYSYNDMHSCFAMHYDIAYQQLDFTDVLIDIGEFLRFHPSETILMRLKEEYDSEDGSQSFEDIFKKYKDLFNNLFWTYTSSNPTLEEVRGKIVLLQDFSASQTYGIPYSSLDTQDQYQVCGSSTPDAMYGKWTAVKDHLQRANGNKTQIHLNYLSGTGEREAGTKGTNHWFIASGYLVQDGSTGAKMIQEDRTDKWPDFPRGDNGQVFYGGMNILTAEFIQKSNLSHVGIVAADFPGFPLINNIIKSNAWLIKKDI